MEFRKLGILDAILKVIEEERFEKPSEIQTKAIPLVISGKDVIAGSATGSGKTLVMGSAIIQESEKGQKIQSLVLTPTRELAEQVARALKQFSKYKHLDVAAVYGGVGINPQIDHLRRADVVVGTPGRLLDHLERRTIDLSHLKILVLDEADRMLDMGFIEDVEKIISQCPKKRQTLLFSATISQDIDYLVNNYMNNPIKVSAEVYVDPSKLKQAYFEVQDNLKFSLLAHFLKNEQAGLVMVFCNTRKTVDFVAKNLKSAGMDAVAIHGGLTQQRRTRQLEHFHSKNAYILVCTDVAARGLDIKGVSHVYNYDIPRDSKEYVHRIGRTARAGKEGKVLNLLTERDHDNFSNVLRNNDVEVVKEETPRVERLMIRRDEPRGRGGFRHGPRRHGQGSHGGPRRHGFRKGPRSHDSGSHEGPRRHGPGSHGGPRRHGFRKGPGSHDPERHSGSPERGDSRSQDPRRHGSHQRPRFRGHHSR